MHIYLQNFNLATVTKGMCTYCKEFCVTVNAFSKLRDHVHCVTTRTIFTALLFHLNKEWFCGLQMYNYKTSGNHVSFCSSFTLSEIHITKVKLFDIFQTVQFCHMENTIFKSRDLCFLNDRTKISLYSIKLESLVESLLDVICSV